VKGRQERKIAFYSESELSRDKRKTSRYC